jgi:Mg-chelatase subunit ChlD
VTRDPQGVHHVSRITHHEAMATTLTTEQQSALLRWRLVLGEGAEQGCPMMALDGDGDQGAAGPLGLPAGMRWGDVDRALNFVYETGERGAGLEASAPYIPQWLEALRTMFRQDTVAMIQKDAIERKGLTSLLLEPETLPHLERNVDLVATLIALKDQIPDQVKATAREIVREIAEQLRRKLENEVRQTVLGAMSRNRHTALKVYRNIDWKRTIQKNLKNYDTERQQILPERFYFWANEKRFRDWQVILVVDQSGSMGPSVVYSSIMASIFASLQVLRTHLILFDTEVVDMTEYLSDPVDILFGAQLGGGTDIAKAVSYAATQVLNPEKTLFLLITDLYEGGAAKVLLQKLQHLVESKVKVLCLLALQDSGRPAYDHDLARQVAALDIPTFAATPKKLLEIMEQILKG